MVSVPPDEESNPFSLPPSMLRTLRDPTIDVLGIVIQYINELPPGFKAQWGDHIFDIELDSLHRIHSGLVKLREDVFPDEDELDAIAHPGAIFEEIATGFQYAAEDSKLSIPSELKQHIQQQIIAPMMKAKETFLIDPERSLIEWWFENLRNDPIGPFSDLGSPSP